MDDGFDEEEDGDGETLANRRSGVEGLCWMEFGHSLGLRFLSLLVLHVLVSFPPLDSLWSRFALQLLMYTRLSPAVDRTLVDYSSHLRLVVCDLVITRSYVAP